MASPLSPVATPPSETRPVELASIRVGSDDSSSLMSPFVDRDGGAPRAGEIQVRSIVAPRGHRDLALASRVIAKHSGMESRLARMASIEADLQAGGASPATIARAGELERTYRAMRDAGHALRKSTSALSTELPDGGWIPIAELDRVARSEATTPLELLLELITTVLSVNPAELPGGTLMSPGDRLRAAVEAALHRAGTAIADRALADVGDGMIEFLIDAAREYGEGAVEVIHTVSFLTRLVKLCCSCCRSD